jgi:hypothetical protein
LKSREHRKTGHLGYVMGSHPHHGPLAASRWYRDREPWYSSAQTKHPNLINRSPVPHLALGSKTSNWRGWKVSEIRSPCFHVILVVLPAGCTAVMPLSTLLRRLSMGALTRPVLHSCCLQLLPPPTAHCPLPPPPLL